MNKWTLDAKIDNSKKQSCAQTLQITIHKACPVGSLLHISHWAPTADGSLLPSPPYCHSFNKSLFILQTLTSLIEHISFKKRKNHSFFLTWISWCLQHILFVTNHAGQQLIVPVGFCFPWNAHVIGKNILLTHSCRKTRSWL